VGESGEILTMEETLIFKENTFGLRTLAETGRITKHQIDGAHLDFREHHVKEVFIPGLLY
jgi:hypothetical protein